MRYYFFSLLLTSLLFLIILHVFQSAPPEARVSQMERTPHRLAEIVLLPTGAGIPAPAWQRQLEAWTDLRDPTIMSLPNDKRGFSEILRIGFERPLKSLPQREINMTIGPPQPLEPLVLSAPSPDPIKSLAAAPLREPFRLPTLPEAPRREARVYITNLAGEPFTLVPQLPNALLDSLEKPLRARRPTEITTFPRGRQVRVTISRSSGNPRLDQLAVSHVLALFSASPAEHEISEDMRPWLDDSHIILVHWHFAPHVINTSDPANEASADDRSWF